MIEIGTVLQDRFLIEERIGSGGMGAVYLAVDQKFDSRVAIKETFYKDANLGEAFEREARLLNSLHHPILPHVSDYFSEGNVHFLVMEYIEGEDLSAVLAREGAFPVENVLRWLDELLDALDYLHSQDPPIIHRDIKPNNLKLTTRGNLVLLDFGLAKLSSGETSGSVSIFGYSRTYSPLEQIEGTGTDARSDIFALGSTAFHLLTGKPPLDALARASAIIAGKPDPLLLASEINPEVPVPVAEVLRSALALNAERRFVSAKGMRQALKFAAQPDLVLEAAEQAESENTVSVPEHQAPDSAEIENFPALAAFAAQTDPNSPELNSEEKLSIQIAIPPVETSAEKAFSKTAAVRQETTQLRRSNKPLLMVAAAIALLIGGSLAAWYMTNRAKSANEGVQVPANQETPVSNPEDQATLAPEVLPEPESSQPKASENTPPPKKTAGSNETKAVKSEEPVVVNKKEPVEPEAKPERNETPERPPISKPRPAPPIRESPQRRNNPVRVESEPPASAIERVITGETAEREQTQEERRQRRDTRRQREQLSEEEKEELRRRRINDILRRNRQPVSPN